MQSVTSRHADKDPSELLVEYLPLLPRGRALDVAMGRGRNALYLASQGFQVVGVEMDAEAVQSCKEEAARRGLTLTTQTADLTQDYQIPSLTYDVMTCFYYLQRDLVPQMREGLREGGVILYETFLIDQKIKTGKPGRREFCLERNELLRLFQGFRVLYYREGFVSEEKAIASLVAQKSPGAQKKIDSE